MPLPTTARSKFNDGRVGEVQHAADIKVGAAGCAGAFLAFALDADIPARLIKGALGALRGQLDFERDILAIRIHGVRVPLRVNEMGRTSRAWSSLVKGARVLAGGRTWQLRISSGRLRRNDQMFRRDDYICL